MSIKNYRFVSPGVFVNEIDNSQVPASPAGMGPVVIGRAASGPALRPTTVSSFEEYVNIFGLPSAGAYGNDVWRQGNNRSATTYGMYASQAYLRNSSPLTYVRLLGADDDSATGAGVAGWAETKAYGLIVFESGSGPQMTGALAAIFYTTGSATLALSGTCMSGADSGGGWTPAIDTGIPVNGTGSRAVILETDGVGYQYKMLIHNYKGTDTLETTFNFNTSDSRYIRKVFNTNPQLVNNSITADNVNYFLGETFDRHLKANISTTSYTMAAVVKLANSTSTNDGSNFNTGLQGAESPQIISCDLGTGPENLFNIVALNEPGDWTNKNVKVSIQDIKRSVTDATAYGSFSVVVRHLSDSDNVVRVLEQFNNCDLNPNSLNYVGRRVGDKALNWNATERRYLEVGNYANNSKYIRVAMNSDVEAGLKNPSLLPFGFRGIVKYLDETTTPLAVGGNWVTGSEGGSNYRGGWPVLPGVAILNRDNVFCVCGPAVPTTATTGSVIFYPAPELRVSASDGNLSNPTDAYFGFQVAQSAGSTVFDTSNVDLLRPRGGIVANMFAGASAGQRELSQQFTLDDISGSGVYVTGSFTDGESLTAVNGFVSGVLDLGYDRFTVPVYGGFDGLNITEMDPFANKNIVAGATETTSYEFYSIRRAIDSVADPEVVEMNMASIPGLTNDGLTTNLLNVCEERADALVVLDLPNAFQPREEAQSLARLNNASTIRTLVNGLRSRGLNSSYGCTFYPWVRARDTISGGIVWLPPSVAAIGTFSSSQRKTQVWFAPAGFNRGGLTEGSAGIPVIDVAHQLRRQDRDDLYSANINPIAKFPAEGIVIFGQKTLQITPSALDRINVRRLMLFLKKRISQIASRLLFDPNVQQTWQRFLAQVNPFLANVKTNFGLSDYKVVLDETTTTPELVDRNIMYAKIFLKPTRAIEYIAIDFNITRTGASFDD